MALLDDMKDMKARLTKLESRDTRGLLSKLFGKGTVALLLAVFLIGGTAQAFEYQIFGLGTQSCGSWTAAKEEDGWMRIAYHAWVAGYLTAYSAWEEKGSGPVSDENTVEGALAWVDNYCQVSPLRSVADAAQIVIHAIKTPLIIQRLSPE